MANGRVYIPFGGRYGDCGNFAGYVASVPTSGTGASAFFSAVPSSGAEGGIWTPPGLSVASDGTLYASVGNGSATGRTWDGSDSVGALGALNRVYLNIGLFSEEWLLHFNPLVGGKPITPIEIEVARKNSVYWQATEA